MLTVVLTNRNAQRSPICTVYRYAPVDSGVTHVIVDAFDTYLLRKPVGNIVSLNFCSQCLFPVTVTSNGVRDLILYYDVIILLFIWCDRPDNIIISFTIVSINKQAIDAYNRCIVILF